MNPKNEGNGEGDNQVSDGEASMPSILDESDLNDKRLRQDDKSDCSERLLANIRAEIEGH